MIHGKKNTVGFKFINYYKKINVLIAQVFNSCIN